MIGQPVRLRILGDGDRLPGNYGWLSWNGSNSTDDLVGSLTPPGNSHTYYNPGTPDNGWTPDYTDRDLDLGDLVQGCPGNKNEDAVRDLLADMWVNSERVAIIPYMML